jgi:CheY-like chemotaxis protein
MSHPIARNALRLYVVENDADTRDMLTMLLVGWGHTVEVASTMSEATAHLAHNRYDVLLSDIGLPDGNGWQMMSRLRTLGVQQNAGYAVAMSGYGMGADLEQSRAVGFRRHLIKPMDIDQLERILLEAAEEAHSGDARDPVNSVPSDRPRIP